MQPSKTIPEMTISFMIFSSAPISWCYISLDYEETCKDHSLKILFMDFNTYVSILIFYFK